MPGSNEACVAIIWSTLWFKGGNFDSSAYSLISAPVYPSRGNSMVDARWRSKLRQTLMPNNQSFISTRITAYIIITIRIHTQSIATIEATLWKVFEIELSLSLSLSLSLPPPPPPPFLFLFFCGFRPSSTKHTPLIHKGICHVANMKMSSWACTPSGD